MRRRRWPAEGKTGSRNPQKTPVHGVVPTDRVPGGVHPGGAGRRHGPRIEDTRPRSRGHPAKLLSAIRMAPRAPDRRSGPGPCRHPAMRGAWRPRRNLKVDPAIGRLGAWFAASPIAAMWTAPHRPEVLRFSRRPFCHCEPQAKQSRDNGGNRLDCRGALAPRNDGWGRGSPTPRCKMHRPTLTRAPAAAAD